MTGSEIIDATSASRREGLVKNGQKTCGQQANLVNIMVGGNWKLEGYLLTIK